MAGVDQRHSLSEPMLGIAILVAALIHSATPEVELRFDGAIRDAVADTARVWAVPVELVRAVIKQESAFNPRAISSCGARGLMQVMPFNAAKVGLAGPDELWEPAKNILAGVRLLAVLLKYYRGDVVASLVAYNAGPRAEGTPVPSNGETPGYVLNILRFWMEYDPKVAGNRK
jgi:soluble lytic murein transglycosylase-like protein